MSRALATAAVGPTRPRKPERRITVSTDREQPRSVNTASVRTPCSRAISASCRSRAAGRSPRGRWRFHRETTRKKRPAGSGCHRVTPERSMAKLKTKATTDAPVTPTLAAPMAADETAAPAVPATQGPYDVALAAGEELRRKPYVAAGTLQTIRQHAKDRMTVWERIEVLQDPDTQPTVLYQNWGPNLDGASIVTAVIKIGGRDVALYGHDFTIRAGSMDATNGRKLANLIYLAGERGIPCIGMNDSAGAFVPAG